MVIDYFLLKSLITKPKIVTPFAFARLTRADFGFEKNFVITILDVNDAPVAYDQSVTTPEDTALTSR